MKFQQYSHNKTLKSFSLVVLLLSLVNSACSHGLTQTHPSVGELMREEYISLKNGGCFNYIPIVRDLSKTYGALTNGHGTVNEVKIKESIAVLSTAIECENSKLLEAFDSLNVAVQHGQEQNISAGVLALYYALLGKLQKLAHENEVEPLNQSSYALIRTLQNNATACSQMFLNEKILGLFIIFHQLKTYFISDVENEYTYNPKYNPTKKYEPQLIARCAQILTTAIIDEWLLEFSKASH